MKPTAEELLDILELIYPLVVAGTRKARHCSDFPANEVQRVLLADGRPAQGLHSFSLREIEEVSV